MKCLSNFFNLLNKSKYTFSIVTNYLTNIYRTIIWIQSRSNWELLVSSTSLCQSLYYVTGQVSLNRIVSHFRDIEEQW